MEFSGPQGSHLLGSLGTLLKQVNIASSAPYKHTTHRVLSLALTYESPAVIGPGLWMYLGTVTEGGDTRKARRECWYTRHSPNTTLPVILSLQRGLAQTSPFLATSCLVLADVPLSQAVGRSLPVCTDILLSDLCCLPPFPDINLRSCLIYLLSTHLPSFQELPPSLPSHPNPHTPAYLFSFSP